MKISVVTPTYNSQETIALNGSSICNQTYENFEHIIIDNKSSDATISIVRQLYTQYGVDGKLKIISEKDEGIASAFNKGIKVASGDIITILNSDDSLFDTNIFREIVTAFQDSTKLIVHGDIYFADSVYGSNVRQPLNDSVIGCVFNHPGMFFRKEVYEELGLYNTDFRYSMDYEFYCRLKLHYKNINKISFYMNKPLVKMNAGGASWENEVESINEIKKALKLHRLWNRNGILYYSGRIIRVTLKRYFTLLGLNSLITLWRRLKWKE